jgi:hypothetical protein
VLGFPFLQSEEPLLYATILDIYEYQSVVRINQRSSIPSVVPVFATPISCETIIHPKGEIVEFTIMMAQNIGVGLTAEE